MAGWSPEGTSAVAPASRRFRVESAWIAAVVAHERRWLEESSPSIGQSVGSPSDGEKMSKKLSILMLLLLLLLAVLLDEEQFRLHTCVSVAAAQSKLWVSFTGKTTVRWPGTTYWRTVNCYSHSLSTSYQHETLGTQCAVAWGHICMRSAIVTSIPIITSPQNKWCSIREPKFFYMLRYINVLIIANCMGCI